VKQKQIHAMSLGVTEVAAGAPWRLAVYRYIRCTKYNLCYARLEMGKNPPNAGIRFWFFANTTIFGSVLMFAMSSLVLFGSEFLIDCSFAQSLRRAYSLAYNRHIPQAYLIFK